MALYRKYRPATFAEVVGQEHVTEPLARALSNGRINHAYLFSGPRGCGKTSSARILARSLNCEAGPTATPCGACGSCVALAPAGPGSLDVIEIDAASHGGVDDARDLRERAFFAPVSSRYKVYIIDEAHMVSSQGFNALLKLVEEPPEFLVFVFATTEPEKVLPTIRSRTHHYPFRLIPPGTLRPLLERICADEGVTVEPSVLPLVVRAGNGSARDSLSVLDQLLAGCGPDGVTYRLAVSLLGVTDAALLDEMLDALAAGDGAAVFQTVDSVVEAGHDPRRFAGDLLERLRDLMVLNAVPDAVSKGLLEHPADQLDRMVEQARRLGMATLSRLAGVVHGGLVEMRGTTSPRLVLELVSARMLLPSVAADGAALLQRLERLERRAEISAAVPPTAGPPTAGDGSADTADLVRETLRQRSSSPAPLSQQPPSTPKQVSRESPSPAVEQSSVAAPAPAPAPTTSTGGTLDGAGVRRVWPEVLDAVKSRSRRTYAILMNATASAVDGDALLLTMSTPPLARVLQSDETNLAHLRAALAQVLGVQWTVRVQAGEAEGREAVAGSGQPGAPALSRVVEDRPGSVTRDGLDEDDMEELRADVSAPGLAAQPVRRDPEETAISLLKATLGARTVGDAK
ncbi:MAG: DNA polymerase III subunit gamma and tau [Actinobacteria bacterium]|nr:DNA polymerase III subunit gamma and tau [Actinomycetota bacterium]MBI3687304.1 DNA polymerase III subunit gamma and tau [Actinomycetota bacterium]